MFGSSKVKPANVVAGVVVSALAGALSFSPSAFAASSHAVQGHVRRAEAALRGLDAGGSVQSGAQLNHELHVSTAQFGTAESMSINLAVQAKTPGARQVAAGALATVAKAEAKAESKLGVVEATLDGAAAVAVAKADLEVTQGRALALSVLGNLSAQGGGDSQQVQKAIAGIAAQAGALLGDVVSGLAATGSGCTADIPSASSGEAFTVQSHLDGIPASAAARLVDAGGTLLGHVANHEVADVSAQVSTSGTCQSAGFSAAQGGASASAQGSIVTSLGL